MMPSSRRNRWSLNQQGLSLIELMISMIIGLVILGGVYQVFLGSTTSYRENEQFARLQENARFAIEILGRRLRMAGYTGCANIPGGIVNSLNDTSFLFDFNTGVQGFEYIDPLDGSVVAADFSPVLDASFNASLANMVEGSDVLTIRQVSDDDPVMLEAAMANAAADLKLPNGTSTALIDTDDVVMVSDCVAAAVFQVSDYTSGTGTVEQDPSTPAFGGADYPGNNAGVNLGQPFGQRSEIVKLSTVSYLVRNNPAGIPSLYSSEYANGQLELVQGVERMQVRYGIDTDGDRQVDSYETAAVASGDWSEVIAVRVALMMQGAIDPKAPLDTATYDLDGDGVNEYDPADERRMRRVFKATIALRNRVS